MTLKITLTIDQENEQGLVLIGLLTKALGRGEAGVSDLRIERDELDIPEAGAEWLKQPAIAKRPYKREGYELGMRAVKTGKPNGVTVILHALKSDPTRAELQETLAASGFNRNGLGATLSKMRKRGYVKRVGEGEWRLTPKGVELEHRLNEKVEHDDRAND